MGRNVLGGINGADVIRDAVRCTGQPTGSIDLTKMRRSTCRGRVCEDRPREGALPCQPLLVFLSSDVAEGSVGSEARVCGGRARNPPARNADGQNQIVMRARSRRVCRSASVTQLSAKILQFIAHRVGFAQCSGKAQTPRCNIASTVEIKTVFGTCIRAGPAHVTSLPAVIVTRLGFRPASIKISPTARPTPVSSIINSAGAWFSSPHNGGRASRSATACTWAGYDRPNGNRCKWRTSTRSGLASALSASRCGAHSRSRHP